MPPGGKITASFAREAATYLRDGEIGRAVELCVAGTQAYPEYAMGHLVLGRCYEALGHTREAIAEYRRALTSLPDNPTILALVHAAEERERKELERSIALQEKKGEDKDETRQREAPMAGSVAEEAPAREETAFEILARRLEEQRRKRMSQPPPPAEEAATQSTPSAEHEPKPPDGVGFVTPTLAEIYASQGAYAEALQAYRALLALHPDNATYAARIRDLEQRTARIEDEKNKAP